MAWSIVSLGTLTTQTAGGLTVNLPASTVSGDLIVLCVSWRSGTAASPTLASGWATAVQELNSDTTINTTASAGCGGIYYIVRGGSAPATGFTFTNVNVLMARAIAYRGNDATPLSATNSGATSTAVTNVSVAGLTTATADELIVELFAGARNVTVSAFDATDPSTASGATNTATAPTVGTWIERQDSGTTSGADCSLGIADAVRATAGATGNLTVTASAAALHAVCAASFKIAVTVASGDGDADGTGGSNVVGTSIIYAAGDGAAAGTGGSSVVGDTTTAGAWSIVGLSSIVTAPTLNPTLTLPAGAAQGDLIVACMVWRDVTADSPVWPSGWTKVTDELNSNNDDDVSTAKCCASMAYIVRGASGPATNVTNEVSGGLVLRTIAYRGNDATPFTADNGGQTSASATATPSLTGLTTTTPNELIVGLFGGARPTSFSAFDATDPSTASGATDTTTNPTVGAWEERSDSQSVFGNGSTLGIVDAVRATAGATGNLTCTAGNSAFHSIIAASFKLALNVEDGVGAAAGTGSSSVIGTALVPATASATAAGAAIGEGESFDFLIPDGDVTLDGWTDQASGIVNIFQSIDEVVTNDADFVQSPAITGTTTDFKVRLFKNAVQIVEWTHSNISASFTEVEQTLTGGEVAAIGTFVDLFIEFDDNAGSVYRFALADAGGTVAAPVTVTYRYRKLTV